MSSVALSPQRSDLCWAILADEEMAQALGIETGSVVVLSGQAGKVQAEVLPPPSPELRKLADEIFEQNREVYEELKRLGD